RRVRPAFPTRRSSHPGAVRDIAEAKGTEGEKLVGDLDRQFKGMFALLETYGDYDQGFVSYDTVEQPQRNELGAQLNALSEPLSQDRKSTRLNSSHVKI